ncbi:MAG: hypothetical protein KR126chlam4_00576 [Candidatus Anoxychlamydiales bacterium]|nr:hypothetical protein [Candidatus Anoxychlamydiales bacterium]NGX40745.1 hypothetical protein [Candidatus Anoxychlamydiales bacterium]HEU64940.1 hypothetical protein [Chlamydiota bacterium]
MSSPSIHTRSAGSPPPLVDRGERNNQTFSRIIRVVLATLGTIASYAFLPPIGATIVSSVLIIATVLSLLGSIRRQRQTLSSPVIFVPSPEPTPVVIMRNPWRTRFSSFIPRSSWFYQSPTITTPSPFTRRDSRIIIIDHEWEQMGSPSFEGWVTMGRPSFADWQRSYPTPRRSVVRDTASASAPRVPAGTGGRTPFEATPAAPRNGLSSYVPTSLWPSGNSRSTARTSVSPSSPSSPPSSLRAPSISSPSHVRLDSSPSGPRIVPGSGQGR